MKGSITRGDKRIFEEACLKGTRITEVHIWRDREVRKSTTVMSNFRCVSFSVDVATRRSVAPGGAGLVGGARQALKEAIRNFRRDVFVTRAEFPDQGRVIHRLVLGHAVVLL